MNIDRIPARPTLAGLRLAVLSAAIATLHFGASAAPAAPVAQAAQTAPTAQAAPNPHAAPTPAVFTRVGDVVITQQDYDAAFAQASRGKFYHGKPPEAEVAKLQREVAQNLIDEVLIAREAKRRKIQPDAAAVNKSIATYEERYKDSAQWKANRAQILPNLKAKLERDSIVEVLQAQVKKVAGPTPAQLEQYYLAHKDKFTSPEQVNLQMILLKVDPSSPQAKWDAARDEGLAIVKRLKGGADFAQQARVHSGDGSAEKGGDMGYVHRGMVPEAAQSAIDKLKPGEITDVVVLLEGIGIFKLKERRDPVLNKLETVKERARDLYMRDKGEEAWTRLLAQLRRDTPAKYDDSRFLPLAKAGEQAPAR
jgi:parvulin-like peptidyl-prolyl isomerase